MCSVHLWIFLQVVLYSTSEIFGDLDIGHCNIKNAKELEIAKISEWSNNLIAKQECGL